MTFLSPVVRLSLWSFILFAICHTNANVQDVRAQLTVRKRVASSYTAIQPYSKIQCVKKYVEEGRRGRCSVAGYDKDIKTCYLSIDSKVSVMAVTNKMSGVFVIQQQEAGKLCKCCFYFYT